MDHQLGFIESLRYSKLGDAVGSFGSTKYFHPTDFDFKCLYHDQTGVVRDGAGDSRTFDIFFFWCATRVRAESPVVLCCA